MPNMSKTTGGRWLLPLIDGTDDFSLQSSTGENGATIATLTTANNFVDADIDIKLKVDGSLLKNGDVVINSTSNIQPNINDQVITITKGYYGTDRTLTVKSSTTGTAAAVTINGSTTSSLPTIAKQNIVPTSGTAVDVGGTASITTTTPSSGYFVAVQASTANKTFSAINPNITQAGYLGDPNQISLGTLEVTGQTGNTYYLPITTGVASGNSTVEIYNTDGSNASTNVSSILGTQVTTEPNTSGAYYIAFTKAGNSSITTAGWFPEGVIGTNSSKIYYPITKAVATVTGSNTVTPSVSLEQSNATNVTLGTSNTSGISIKAVGGGTAQASAAANITTAGYAPGGNNFATNNAINATSQTTNITKYITAVTIPASKSLTITNSGTANITNTGTTVVTSNSTSTETITVKAKTAAGDSVTTDYNVVLNGLWNTKVADGNGPFYGRVTVPNINGSIGGTPTAGKATAAIEAISYSGTGKTNLNKTTTEPSGTAGIDYWQIKATASGTAGGYKPKYTVTTAGWLASTVEASSNASVSVTGDSTGKSIYIPKATFAVNAGTVYCATAGYIPAGSASAGVGTITNGVLSAVDSDPGNNFSENSEVVMSSGGYLQMTAGYYPATKISLATLVPDGSNIGGHAEYLLQGKTAYDNNGVLVTGNIATYTGSYTIVTT